MTIYDQRYLEYVHEALRGKMDAQHLPTPQSWSFRKRASDLARQADSNSDLVEQIELMKLALHWIQLAENEEFLALHRPTANDN
jgi:hypothetical protein